MQPPKPGSELAAIPEGLSEGDFHELLIKNDWNQIAPERRAPLLAAMCRSLSLNPLTNPIQLVPVKGGGLRPYATKGCAEQLRMLRGVSIEITERDTVGDIFCVTAEAKMPDGRTDTAMGAVSIANLRGEDLANAFMKAETKAKRRATLSICGLGMLDESEVESAGGDTKPRRTTPPPAAAAPKASVVVEPAAPVDPTPITPAPVVTEGEYEEVDRNPPPMTVNELAAWSKSQGLTFDQVKAVVAAVGGAGVSYADLTEAQQVEVGMRLGDLIAAVA